MGSSKTCRSAAGGARPVSKRQHGREARARKPEQLAAAKEQIGGRHDCDAVYAELAAEALTAPWARKFASLPTSALPSCGQENER
jgi:hypothetical protein